MDATGARLIIVCGLPGAGKTTHAKLLEAKLGAIRLSADDWMDALAIDLWNSAGREKVEVLQWQFCRELLARGLTVIIEWGTWGRSERDTLREGARALGATVELHYLSASLDVLFERVRRRRMENPPICREQLEEWAANIQVPTAEEMALFDEAFVLGT